MWQRIRCVRFGEVLLDENKQIFLLCTNCNTDYHDLHTFRVHLDNCNGLEHLVRENITIGFNSDKGRSLMGKAGDTVKEYLIYEANEVIKVDTSNSKADNLEMDLIKIEEELLDPRWYDLTVSPEPQDKILAYKELVEAVTPYVQFKENVKTNLRNSSDNRNVTTTAANSKANPKNKKLINAASIQVDLRQAQQQKSEKPPTLVKRIVYDVDELQKNGVVNKKLTSDQGNSNPSVHNTSGRNKTFSNSKNNSPMVQLPKKVTTALQTTTAECKPITADKKAKRRNTTCKTVNMSTAATTMLREEQTQPVTQAMPAPIVKRRQTIAISMDKPVVEPEFKNPFAANNRKPLKLSPAKILQSIATNRNQQKLNLQSQQQQPQSNMNNAMIVEQFFSGTKSTVPAKQRQQDTQQQQQQLRQATNTPAKAKQTEQILNKLQTLGLQVKRTHPQGQEPQTNKSTTSKTDDKTMELLKKLQSKGMKVQIINKNTNLGAVTKAKATTQTAKANTSQGQTLQTQQKKAVINRNLIIKKVK